MLTDLLKYFHGEDDALPFIEIQKSIISSGCYNPDSEEFDTVIQLIEDGEYQRAIDIYHENPHNLMLSSRVHYHLANAFQMLDDNEQEELEYYLHLACITGMLSTGEGTEESPFFVLRVSDEYDLLSHIDYKPIEQAIITKGSEYFDRIECEEGDIWFDVTHLFKHSPLRQPFSASTTTK